jgi:hypothetical protein
LQETSNKSYKKKKSFVADKPTEVTVVADKPTEVAVNFELHDSKSQETRPKKNPTKENSFVAKRPPNVAVGLEIQDSRVRVDVPDKLYTKKKPNPGKGSAKRAKHKPKVFKSYRQPDTKYVQRNGGAETRETLKQDNTGIQKDATLSASSRKLHLRLDDNTKSGKRPGFKFARPNLTKDGVPEKSGNSPLKRKKLKNPKKRIR